jgi:hypothetical protein
MAPKIERSNWGEWLAVCRVEERGDIRNMARDQGEKNRNAERVGSLWDIGGVMDLVELLTEP